jgi:hypothetical protein
MAAVMVPQNSRLPPVLWSYRLKPTKVAVWVFVAVNAPTSVADMLGEFAAANVTVCLLKNGPPENADVAFGEDVTMSSHIADARVGVAP